jgi:hypothetical protein
MPCGVSLPCNSFPLTSPCSIFFSSPSLQATTPSSSERSHLSNLSQSFETLSCHLKGLLLLSRSREAMATHSRKSVLSLLRFSLY